MSAMKLDRRHWLAGAAGIALSGCTPAVPKPKSDSGTLNASIGLPEPHAIFAPGGGGSGPGFAGSKVLERLIRLNEDQSFAPVLATAWRFENDGRDVHFTLRDGVTWHDGKPLTGADVVWSALNYWKAFSPETLFDFLEGVEAQGAEVVLRFRIPLPQQSFLTLLGNGTNYVLPRHLYEGTDILLNPVNNAPIGTGPWRFSKWVRGSHAEFARNPTYWAAGQPKTDRLIIRWFREPASRVAALETGQVDIAVQSPAALNDLARLKTNPKLGVGVETDLGGGGSLYYNTRRPIFDNVKVRQALLHAIDRDFIARTIYAGYGVAAISPLYSTNTLYFTTDVPRYAFDPRKAEALLDAAGYPRKADGKRFTAGLLASGWYEENGKVGAYLKQAFADIGVDVTLTVPDRANSLKALYSDYDFDIAYSQAGGSASEPLPALGLIYSTAGIKKGLNFRNASRFSDPQTDRLIQQITVEVDPETRKRLIQDFARRVTEQVPVVPLVEVPPHYIYQKSVRIGDRGISLTTDSWGDISKS